MTNSSLIITKDSNNLDSYKNIPEELIWYQNITSIYTRRTYQDSVSSFCKFFNIKNIEQLRDVDSIHIIQYRDELIKEGHKNSTINTRLASLSSMFKHLIEKQLLKTNPVYGVKRMKKQYRKVKSRPLTDIEVSAILKQPNTKTLLGLRDKAILSIFLNIGTRRGTILRFKGRDVTFDDGYLILDMHLKGDKRNLVAANSHIHATLSKYLKAMGYYREGVNGEIIFAIPDDVPLFPRMSNNPKLHDFNEHMTDKGIYLIWRKYAERAGISKRNPHCARSTFITKAFKNDCDVRKVQYTVGHADPRTTMGYNHADIDYNDSASFAVNFGG